MKKFLRRLFPSPEMRAFHKMRRRHRKELLALAKETGEWDYGWLHEMVMVQIRHMHEYYSAGNNVWQSDETRQPIIEELKYILDLDDKLDRTYDEDTDYVTVEKKRQKLYEELYTSIGKNLRNWWD